MFVGHGLVAFAIVAFVTHALGWDRERALTAALVAGAFGLAPDVDILYAPVGLLGAETVMGAAEGFWSTGNIVHRAVTHSLIVASVTALAVWLVALGGKRRLTAVLPGAVLVAAASLVSGALGGAVMTAFLVVVAVITAVATRYGLDARTVAATAVVGLASHPFGDLLTGEPPALLYPFDVTLVAARPAVFADPTLNLLAPLFVELTTFWLALVAYARLGGFSVRGYVRRHLRGRAGMAAVFGASALLLPAPTLETSYYFVLLLVGLGIALATPLPRVDARTRSDLRKHPPRAVATGLAAVTLAAIAYTVVYLTV